MHPLHNYYYWGVAHFNHKWFVWEVVVNITCEQMWPMLSICDRITKTTCKWPLVNRASVCLTVSLTLYLSVCEPRTCLSVQSGPAKDRKCSLCWESRLLVVWLECSEDVGNESYWLWNYHDVTVVSLLCQRQNFHTTTVVFQISFLWPSCCQTQQQQQTGTVQQDTLTQICLSVCLCAFLFKICLFVFKQGRHSATLHPPLKNWTIPDYLPRKHQQQVWFGRTAG